MGELTAENQRGHPARERGHLNLPLAQTIAVACGLPLNELGWAVSLAGVYYNACVIETDAWRCAGERAI